MNNKNKVGFVLYELHFYKDNNGCYWSEKLVNYDFLQRYLQAFDEIVVCARIVNVEEASSSMMKISGPNVKFCDLPDTYGIRETLKKLHYMKKIIKFELKSCDAIITRSPSMLFMLLFNTLYKSKKPISTDVALSADCLIDGKGIIKKICNHIIDIKYKKIIKKINGVSYVTNHVLQKKYPCKAFFCENSKFFTSSFSTIVINEEDFYKKEWTQSVPKVIKIVHTGFMNDDRKCQTKVLYIVKGLIQKGYNIEATFIGDGQMKEKLIQLSIDYGIREKCFFKGLITDKKKLLEELRKSDFFVFPTKAEGLPRSIIEAMSQGLVCISSPVDGVVELLEEDNLVDWWKADEYIKVIEDYIKNWQKMEIESSRNYSFAQNYLEKNLKKKREDFYKKLRDIS